MVSEFFATYLENQSLGTKGTDLFVSQMPDKDDVICLFDEQGIDQDYFQAYASDAMGLQVMVQGSYSFCKDKIWDIHKNIVGLTNQDQTDYRLVVVQIQSLPQQIELDEQGRRIWTAHYDVLVNTKNDVHRQSITQP
jgi:hypothetical protein